MTESRSRTPVYQEYYTPEDYEQVIERLPELVKEAEMKASEVVEPTIYEKREVMRVVEEFIRDKKRKVYGGTAVNELLKAVNPEDAIYDSYNFADMEFYTPTPVPDMVELCDILYKKGYKYVIGSEAQHEETYTIRVNLQVYCDISYVPTRIYNAIKTIEINGILYTDPHFMLIDYLRMFTDPMNAAWRWEKGFKRIYKILNDYPLEHFNKPIKIPKPTREIEELFGKIKNDLLPNNDIHMSCLISGFDAYNFFVRHAAKDRNVEQMSRTTYQKSNLLNLMTNVPYLDLVSVDYRNNVEQIYQYIRDNVENKDDVTLDEYYPLFQFVNYSAIINYKGNPVVRIIEADGMCIPNIKTTRNYMYVSYQYLLMSMLINKFRSHLDKNKEMYFNYGIAISNLVKIRNIYLSENNLGVINRSVFGEFKISCVGSTVSFTRSGFLRRLNKKQKGKHAQFTYNPESFFKQTEEQQELFDPKKYIFKNSSGNKITNEKNLIFKIGEYGNIIESDELSDASDATDTTDATENTEEPSEE